MTALARLLAAWLLGASNLLAFAQAPQCPPPPQPLSAEQVQAGMRDARDHGFLWRISKDGHDSWLFGTLHVGKAAWAFPGPKMSSALKASDTIALEIDPLDPDIQRRLAHTLTSQPHTPLPAALQQRLDKVARDECVPPEALATLSPEMQVATLTTLAGRRDGLDAGYGADVFLSGWGHGAKRAVVSLESPEMQLGLLLGANTAETVASVDHSLTEIEEDKTRPTLSHIAQVWADGDWQGLSTYDRWCGCLDTPSDRAEMARVLDDRNPGMAAGIDALHASGQRVFAAVGSLHMIGPSGLPAQMARRGYRVEQIAYDRPTETKP